MLDILIIILGLVLVCHKWWLCRADVVSLKAKSHERTILAKYV